MFKINYLRTSSKNRYPSLDFSEVRQVEATFLFRGFGMREGGWLSPGGSHPRKSNHSKKFSLQARKKFKKSGPMREGPPRLPIENQDSEASKMRDQNRLGEQNRFYNVSFLEASRNFENVASEAKVFMRQNVSKKKRTYQPEEACPQRDSLRSKSPNHIGML